MTAHYTGHYRINRIVVEYKVEIEKENKELRNVHMNRIKHAFFGTKLNKF